MSEQVIIWLIGGLAAFAIYELRAIRNSIEKMRDSIEKLSINDENHRHRLNRIEKVLEGRPCIHNTAGLCTKDDE